MKVTVVGAGAVGGYFGGRLQEAGFDVTYLVREKRAQQLKETGLIIRSPFGDAELVPKTALAAEEIEACDLVILGVKNYHLKEAIESIRPLFEKGAKVLPLLNGIEHFDILQREFGEEAVLGGICQIISTLDREGRILHTNQMHEITFGPLTPGQEEFCRQLEEAVEGANMKLKLSKDVRVDMWSKYAFITAFSGVTTASRLPINEVLMHEPTLEVFRLALSEMRDLAGAKGVTLSERFADKTVDNMYRLPEGATSSMHQDFRKGLPLEVEYLQGAAVRIARQAGIEVPTVRTLYGLIKPYEYGGAK
ncbi:ketopantoate reductase family protein [Effusibacillus lacus]|uniref:2-dehydropantoate 2-reductase n=1 Tax=Effusibacillus lacus TaxID=1348429 RepID=A0A292YE67_9BACL|nr:ketopantoate reductase family protein [Effusibacillus lacus]TCS76821.1 ketopantoate reductase [Effusibacillus lacus]GAX91152.1 2-dehydropantoate 2-reductase [Effusibacillus lacus]